MIGSILQLGGSIYGLSQANKANKAAEKDLKKTQKELNKAKEAYSNVDTSNPFADLTNVTLADEDTNSILTYNANRAIQGNVSMQ